MNADIITRYFPNLSDKQKEQFEKLYALYKDWNDKINVISRKDIDNLYERHILHSLTIAAFLGELVPKTRIVDVGTGGGFPGVPLAILYPHASFHLVDRIGKKLKVAENVCDAVNVENITFQHGDMSECRETFDFAVSRAAMRLDMLIKIVRRNISSSNRNKHKNGLICLKGGDLTEETKGINLPVIEFPIKEYFHEDFFDTKKIIYVPIV